MRGLATDLRRAFRAFRKSPAFAAVVVATVALGVGANAAIFGVVDSIFLRPLPFPDARRLVRVRDSRRSPDGQETRFNVSTAHFLEIARRAGSFEAIAAQSVDNRTLLGGTPERIAVVRVSPGTWPLFGVSPYRGRVFTAAEERDAPLVAIISHELGERRYGDASAAVGRLLPLDSGARRIVGVMAAGFRFPYDASVWVPSIRRANDPSDWAVFARRRRSVSLRAARAEAAAISGRMAREVPDAGPGYGIDVEDMRTSLQENRDRVALTLLALVGSFLLIACSNASILLLARSFARRREIAIRFALGASRFRQWRGIAAESLALSLTGGVVGLVLAVGLERALGVLVPSNLTAQLGVPAGGLDFRIVAFAAAASAAAGLAAASIPLLRFSEKDTEATLRAGARAGSGRHDRRALRALASAEAGLSLALLFGAGRMVERYRDLSRRDVGFPAAQVLTLRMTVPPRATDVAARDRFVGRVLAAAAAVPGVEAAGATTINPLGPGGTWESPVFVEGVSASSSYSVNYRLITPGLFRAMGIPILGGRPFETSDSAGREPVAVVSRRLAARFWPGESAIGRRIRREGPAEPWRRIVGVAGDVADEGDLRETWYLPYAQQGGVDGAEGVHLMLRAPRRIDGLAASVEAAIQRVEPDLPFFEVATMDRVRMDSLSQERLGAAATVLFAVVGLLLAELGTFGIVAYAARRRSRELSIRATLGASPSDIRRAVAGEAGLVAAGGVGIGAILVVTLSPLLARWLEQPARHPLVLFAGLAVILAGVSGLASIGPARRASRIDLVTALREE